MLYIHIPFCVRKCHYCDFLSGAYSKQVRERYLKALQREIRSRCADVRSLQEREVTSIFIGGGTPSVLLPEEMALIMETIRNSMEISDNAEISMECNPGTADLAKLKGYRELGINRLSIGLQSADDAELRLLGRIHTWEEFLQTYRNAYEAGFENVNLDLMSALPGQTVEKWQATLKAVLALDPLPRHVSAYSLILEEGTRFHEWEKAGRFQGELALPTEEADREMYALTERLLKEHGFQKYEISNYAKPGYECRHNTGYWLRRDYLGLGLGAASLIGDYRYHNTESLEDYLKEPLGNREEQRLSTKDQMEETMFLGLRLCEGVSKESFEKTFGARLQDIYGDVIAKNVRDGLLLDEGDRLRLTARGMDVSNYVMSQFLLS